MRSILLSAAALQILDFSRVSAATYAVYDALVDSCGSSSNSAFGCGANMVCSPSTHTCVAKPGLSVTCNTDQVACWSPSDPRHNGFDCCAGLVCSNKLTSFSSGTALKWVCVQPSLAKRNSLVQAGEHALAIDNQTHHHLEKRAVSANFCFNGCPANGIQLKSL